MDRHHDFIIFRSYDGSSIFEDYPIHLRGVSRFESFLGFGLSHETDGEQHITHRTGTICSITPDYRGRLLASSSIDGGDSGGPAYSAFDGSLIGIMVASTSTNPKLTSEYDDEETNEEIAKASSAPADTWIASAPLIWEAYKVAPFEPFIYEMIDLGLLGQAWSSERSG